MGRKLDKDVQKKIDELWELADEKGHSFFMLYESPQDKTTRMLSVNNGSHEVEMARHSWKGIREGLKSISSALNKIATESTHAE